MNNNIERFLLSCILVIMVVSAVVGTIASQRIEDAVKNTDLITSCITPGTSCFKFAAKSKIEEQEYLRILMKTTNLCVLRVSREAPEADSETLSMLYDECVEVRTPPVPADPDSLPSAGLK